MLTEREAADMRAKVLAGDIAERVERKINPLGGLRIGVSSEVLHGVISDAAKVLRDELVAVYAGLDDAFVNRNAFVAAVYNLVTEFVFSSLQKHDGADVWKKPDHFRLAMLSAENVGPAFDAAAHQAATQRANRSRTPRPMSEKFKILESPSHFEADFVEAIGPLGAAVIYLDLDNFKATNTTFTEPVVDRSLLPELHRLVRGLVADRGLAYAEGGDEILVLLPNTCVELAEPFARLLLDHLRRTCFMIEGNKVRVTGSAGVACSASKADAVACKDAAAKAKKAAKEQGKDRYVLAAPIS